MSIPAFDNNHRNERRTARLKRRADESSRTSDRVKTIRCLHVSKEDPSSMTDVAELRREQARYEKFTI